MEFTESQFNYLADLANSGIAERDYSDAVKRLDTARAAVKSVDSAVIENDAEVKRLTAEVLALKEGK